MTETTGSVDVLMITYNAAEYVAKSLPALLDSCDEFSRVWLWHNGTDEATLEAARQHADHPCVHAFHHSVENVGLAPPTNWLWSKATGQFVGKVDDDCLLPADWIQRLRRAHGASALFGALGASRLRPEDLIPGALDRKRQQINGTELVRNHWVQGSGYLLRREWVDRVGPLRDGQSWTEWCLGLAHRGAINGFAWPLLFEDHMDDPRSPNTLLLTDDDLRWRMPLSAARSRVETLDDWQRRLERSAVEIQRAPLDLRAYSGWRRRLRNARQRVNRARRA